jgi:hypothetical protein
MRGMSLIGNLRKARHRHCERSEAIHRAAI